MKEEFIKYLNTIGITTQVLLNRIEAIYEICLEICPEEVVDIFVDEYVVPRLTTVSKDAIGMGRTAVQLLTQRIEESTRPRQVIEKKSRFILRESTGAVPVIS